MVNQIRPDRRMGRAAQHEGELELGADPIRARDEIPIAVVRELIEATEVADWPCRAGPAKVAWIFWRTRSSAVVAASMSTPAAR